MIIKIAGLLGEPNVAYSISIAVKAAEERLGDSGRVLLRASGTEALVRVMVEAASDSLAQEVAQQLADVVKKEISL
jgi:phosphoglucosamine mutase